MNSVSFKIWLWLQARCLILSSPCTSLCLWKSTFLWSPHEKQLFRAHEDDLLSSLYLKRFQGSGLLTKVVNFTFTEPPSLLEVTRIILLFWHIPSQEKFLFSTPLVLTTSAMNTFEMYLFGLFWVFNLEPQDGVLSTLSSHFYFIFPILNANRILF